MRRARRPLGRTRRLAALLSAVLLIPRRAVPAPLSVPAGVDEGRPQEELAELPTTISRDWEHADLLASVESFVSSWGEWSTFVQLCSKLRGGEPRDPGDEPSGGQLVRPIGPRPGSPGGSPGRSVCVGLLLGSCRWFSKSMRANPSRLRRKHAQVVTVDPTMTHSYLVVVDASSSGGVVANSGFVSDGYLYTGMDAARSSAWSAPGQKTGPSEQAPGRCDRVDPGPGVPDASLWTPAPDGRKSIDEPGWVSVPSSVESQPARAEDLAQVVSIRGAAGRTSDYSRKVNDSKQGVQNASPSAA